MQEKDFKKKAYSRGELMLMFNLSPYVLRTWLNQLFGDKIKKKRVLSPKEAEEFFKEYVE